MYYFIKNKIVLSTPNKEIAKIAREKKWKRVTKSAYDQQVRANEQRAKSDHAKSH